MKALQGISRFVSKQRKDENGDLYLFKVSGDCMEPTIHSGDIVVANMQEKNVLDSLYLVNFDGKIAVRRLQNCLDGHVRIICDNPLYKSPDIAKLKELNVIGRCTGIMKRI